MVICVQDKSQIQALYRTQPLLPIRPGQVEARTHDYVRHGTATLLAALGVTTGEVTGRTLRAPSASGAPQVPAADGQAVSLRPSAPSTAATLRCATATVRYAAGAAV